MVARPAATPALPRAAAVIAAARAVQAGELTQHAAAARFTVSRSAVAQACLVLQRAPALVAAVEAGEISPGRALVAAADGVNHVDRAGRRRGTPVAAWWGCAAPSPVMLLDEYRPGVSCWVCRQPRCQSCDRCSRACPRRPAPASFRAEYHLATTAIG